MVCAARGRFKTAFGASGVSPNSVRDPGRQGFSPNATHHEQFRAHGRRGKCVAIGQVFTYHKDLLPWSGSLEPRGCEAHWRANRTQEKGRVMNRKKVAKLVKDLLVEIGEDPNREGLLKTPDRVTSVLELLTSGYQADQGAITRHARFLAEANNMVILKDIEVYSLCEHHMLPFFGKCHIGYIPKTHVIGVSKLARLVDSFARRLQIQERLTSQIAQAILDTIGAEGVGVVMECRHLCMMMRGVEKQNSIMTTSSVLGSFRSSATTRQEFLSLIAQK